MIYDPVLKKENTNHELYIGIEPLSKLYTDNTGCFLVHMRSSNQYITIVYQCDFNVILDIPFKPWLINTAYWLYDSIIQCPKDKNTLVGLYILDNKASK